MQRTIGPEGSDQASQRANYQDRNQNSSGRTAPVQQGHRPQENQDGPETSLVPDAPSTLARTICQPERGVEVRLTQVSASRSKVTPDAAAPATASSQKAVYQPTSRRTAHASLLAARPTSLKAVLEEVKDSLADASLHLGHDRQGRVSRRTIAGTSTSRVKRSVGAK